MSWESRKWQEGSYRIFRTKLKAPIFDDQIRELQAYLSRLDSISTESSDDVTINQALAISGEKCNSYMGEWIVDSGGTLYMIEDPKVFYEYKLSSGKECVSLADDSSISVAGKWSLLLLNKFLVHNVLHLPHLPLNLLFVNKITKELNCDFIFSANHCVLQDLLTEKRIEICLVSEGIYRLLMHVASALLMTVNRSRKGREDILLSVMR